MLFLAIFLWKIMKSWVRPRHHDVERNQWSIPYPTEVALPAQSINFPRALSNSNLSSTGLFSGGYINIGILLKTDKIFHLARWYCWCFWLFKQSLGKVSGCWSVVSPTTVSYSPSNWPQCRHQQLLCTNGISCLLGYASLQVLGTS